MSADPPIVGPPVTGDSETPVSPRRRRRPSRRRIMFLAAAFLAGTLVGVSVAMMAAPDVLARRMMRARGGDMTKAMTSELNLTPEQELKVHAAIAPHVTAIRSIMGDARARVDEEMRGIDRDVMPLLDATQQQRWRGRAERMKRFRSHQPGDGQHGRTPGSPHKSDHPTAPTQ